MSSLKRMAEVTMKYPDVYPCLQKVKSEEVRKRLERCFSSRCQDLNTSILEEIIALRDSASLSLSLSLCVCVCARMNL
jgi:Zn-dependent oligopeptidase